MLTLNMLKYLCCRLHIIFTRPHSDLTNTGKHPLSPWRMMYIYSCTIDWLDSGLSAAAATTYTNTQQADTTTTGINKKLMENDQNDRNATNSIIKLSKAFDDIKASKQTIFVSPYLHSSIQHATSRWKRNRKWQETHGFRPKWPKSNQQHH